MGNLIGIPEHMITLNGNTNGFFSKFLIERNSVENIFKPNILQTLLGRKKREIEVIQGSTGFVTEDCVEKFASCLRTSAETSFSDVDKYVSVKFRRTDLFRSLMDAEEEKCKTKYQDCNQQINY